MTRAEIAEFEAGIHRPETCPWSGPWDGHCSQCWPAMPRTAHRSICIDAESGDVDCTCELAGQ